jgi:hypothetical protein
VYVPCANARTTYEPADGAMNVAVPLAPVTYL